MIRNRKMQAQFISYDSLAFNKEFENDPGKGVYHPADIDGILQFSAKTHPMSEKYNQAVLIYEFKNQHAFMPIGQKILLESLINAIQQNGGFALAAVVRHNVQNPDIDVDGGRDGIVSEYFYDGAWRTCNPMTAVAFTDLFMIGAGLKKGGKE